MDAIGKLVDQIGYATAFIYAAAAYGLFYWLDKNLSDAAKSVLAGMMKLRELGSQQIASAVVEVFDRLYTRPLLHWRALSRSTLFTVAVSGGWLLERLATRQLRLFELDIRS
jgi:hypothetical protein